MNNNRDIEPFDWVNQSCKEPWKEAFKSIHFDHFEKYKADKLQGIHLLDYAFFVLTEACRVTGNVLDKTFRPLIYLPLGSSQEIRKWDEKNWESLGNDYEPPSLYILTIKDVFDLYVEEYKCPVAIPFQSKIPVVGIFRCSRSPEEMKNSWEFSSGVYLYRKEDF